MQNASQGNEAKAHVVIIDGDGETVHNVKRTVFNIENDGEIKTGQATIKGKTFNLVAERWKWIGNAYDYQAI